MNLEKRYSVMTHMVAGYPDVSRSELVAEALVAGGAAYLEIQFPYSDPSADGPAIQQACGLALAGGFTKAWGFEFVRRIVDRFQVPVFIMSYGGLVYSGGVETFCSLARDSGAAGLIVPDLTPGHDEGLYRVGRDRGLAIVPVVVPTISKDRLQCISKEEPEFIYAALRSGVTGKSTSLGEGAIAFLDRLSAVDAKIFAGFGIRSREQISVIAPRIHAAIVGSMIVRTIEENRRFGDTVLYDRISNAVGGLVGPGGEKEETERKRS